MLQKTSEQVAECLRRAAEAEARAEAASEAEDKDAYRRIAATWRKLARSYEFQGSLTRFISFNTDRQEAAQEIAPVVPAANRQTTSPGQPNNKVDLLDWLASVSDRVRPYSPTAFAIALASVAASTLLRSAGGWTSGDLHFAVYLPGILATGLLAGVPAAMAATIASALVVFWAFMPPYFAFKWPNEDEQLNIFFNVVPGLITVLFAYLCRHILQRLRRTERNNRVLVRELEHRGRNLFSILEVIVHKSLPNNPECADNILGRLKSIRYSNELLAGKSRSISIKDLLQNEFAAYGTERLRMTGAGFEIEPDRVRHLILLFHELTTNAVKYGSLSCNDGQVFVEWQREGRKIVLTWKERGGPVVTVPKKRGFGNQLIESCVAALSATRQEDFAADGYSCMLTFSAAPGGRH